MQTIGRNVKPDALHYRIGQTVLPDAVQNRIGQLYFSHGNYMGHKQLNLFMNSHIIVHLRLLCGLARKIINLLPIGNRGNRQRFTQCVYCVLRNLLGSPAILCVVVLKKFSRLHLDTIIYVKIFF